MQRITPFLWFSGNAEQAVKFYTSVFKKSKIAKISRYDKASAKATGQRPGSVMLIVFELEGQQFMALNGSDNVKFNQAISLLVNCKTQAELDRYWKKLSAGGEEVVCGWLKDKFGLSWQVAPAIIGDLLSAKDPAKSARVMEAVMKMVKLDIKTLKDACAGKTKKLRR